jgi:hypothetical protein
MRPPLALVVDGRLGHWSRISFHGSRSSLCRPPWLSYRYMTAEMQRTFKQESQIRNLWAGAKVATHQDLSAYFVVKCIESYLRDGGRFAFVMPLAVLSRLAYAGCREGNYGSGCSVAFE